MRRFTRLTNGFSKKVEMHAASVALHFVYYNLLNVIKRHRWVELPNDVVHSLPYEVSPSCSNYTDAQVSAPVDPRLLSLKLDRGRTHLRV